MLVVEAKIFCCRMYAKLRFESLLKLTKGDCWIVLLCIKKLKHAVYLADGTN